MTRWTERWFMSGLVALADATGVSLVDLTVVADHNPGTVIAVVEVFTACAVAIAEGEPEYEVHARVRVLLAHVAAIRAQAAGRRWAA